MNLNEIYHSNYSVVYNYLKKVLWKSIDEININEIINKSFFEFYKKKEKKYDTYDDIKYICKIAYNVMRNSYMYKKRYYNKNITLESYHYNYHSKTDILTQLLKKERSNIIRQGIELLDKEEKNIIVLYYFHNINLRKISLITNTKYHKVCKLKKKGLYHLKEYLTNIDYDPY